MPDPTPHFEWTHPVLNTPCIWCPEAPRDGYSVALFRRRFILSADTPDLRLWVSASQRYELYLDGQLIARGPSRSDENRWYARPVDVSVPAGQHVLAARVAHFGPAAGMGQLGGPAFFLLHAENLPEQADRIDTGKGWLCAVDLSRTPLNRTGWGTKGKYNVVGAGENFDASKAVRGWSGIDFDDSDWQVASELFDGAADRWGNRHLGCFLRPEWIPPMEEFDQQFSRVARCPEGLCEQAEALIAGTGGLTVPAGRELSVVLDIGELTNAYPTLKFSGGAGAVIETVSAEAAYGENRYKGNRDEIEGKDILGQLDEIHPDGSDNASFTPLWFRSLRYMELRIRTANQPLTLDGIDLRFTGYPMPQLGRWEVSPDPDGVMDTVREVTHRTARLCAHETFFDCPHYEQCQFPGDTRVQIVYQYLTCNDDRLARKAIDDFYASRTPGGLLQSRYPSRKVQIIPTFSLYWLGILEDFRVYRGDTAFLRLYLNAAREIIDWFGRRIREDGMLGYIEHAPFTDWARHQFDAGNAPQGPDGGSSILTLLYADACGWLAELERCCGFPSPAKKWRKRKRSLIAATLQNCWDPERKVLADTPAMETYSVHPQVLGVLAGAWQQDQTRDLLTRALDDETITPVGTLYWRYYVAQAFKAAGMEERFFDLLQDWPKMLEGTGLTTWPESDLGTPRSDCHAWSVTPGIELPQTVLGVRPDREVDGFARCEFAPNLGRYDSASGTVPTPHGQITVSLTRESTGVVATIDSPVDIHVLKPDQHLPAGKHRVYLPG